MGMTHNRRRTTGYLTVLQEDVEQDDADLVGDTDAGVQENRYNKPHGILDLLSLGIRGHCQVLKGTEDGRDQSST